MESTDLARGSIVGSRYVVGRVIGDGGMGTVYLATTLESNRDVALKVLHPLFVNRPDRQQRFAKEASFSTLHGRLPGHPNLVTTVDSGVDPNAGPYIAMEHIKGPALGGLSMVLRRALTPEEVYPLALGVARGLDEVHKAGLVHRDLTPTNVLVANCEGERIAKIIDFSHAASVAGPRLCLGEPGRLTAPNEVPGTPGYMAPEQVQHAYPHPSMDVFAFGVIFWELLANQHAFRERERIPYCRMQTSRPAGPCPLASVRRDLPQAVYSLIDACTLVDPDGRPSASDIVVSLEQIEGLASSSITVAAHRSISATGHSKTGHSKGKIAATILGLLLGAMLLVGLWILATDQTETVRSSPATPRAPSREAVKPARPQAKRASPQTNPMRSVGTAGSQGSEDVTQAETTKTAELRKAPERNPSVPPRPKQPADKRSPPSRSKKSKDPDMRCAQMIRDAISASELVRWESVVRLTRSRKCWATDARFVSLRAEALLELKRWAQCVALARTTTDPKTKRVGKLCASALAKQEGQ